MASHRLHPARPVQAEVDKEQVRRDKADGRRVAPRAGRTGGLGARAERPSEGTGRTDAAEDTSSRTPEPARGAKAPSAGAQSGRARTRP
jgi:hypothetical protein